jgi:hypothetical protein
MVRPARLAPGRASSTRLRRLGLFGALPNVLGKPPDEPCREADAHVDGVGDSLAPLVRSIAEPPRRQECFR